MRVSIVAVGRLRGEAERELGVRYFERAGQLAAPLGIRFDVREIAQSRKSRPEERREEEGAAIVAAISEDAVLVVLDENGRELTSAQFADRIRSWREAGGDVAFAIGGPDGLAPSVVARAELVVAFGRMSWPHQLARAMLAEQLYRAMTILTGHPYHRA